MIGIKQIRKAKNNYFLTDEEVSILWKESKRWSSKWRLMLGFALFRGLRVGEICAINLYDFKDDFTKVTVILEKSHIKTDLPLIPELTALVKDYILKNRHTFKDGYLFPYYSSRGKKHLPYMTTKTACSCFCKFRKTLGKEHLSLLDSYIMGKYRRYRVGWHSCRRWFETKIYDKINDRKKLADIMRYIEVSTVDTYIDPYETWKHEKDILQTVFDDTATNLILLSKGQRKLDFFT